MISKKYSPGWGVHKLVHPNLGYNITWTTKTFNWLTDSWLHLVIVIVFLSSTRSLAASRKYPYLTLFETKMAKSIPYFWPKMAKNPYPLGSHIPILIIYYTFSPDQEFKTNYLPMWIEKSPRTEPGLDFAYRWKKDKSTCDQTQLAISL